MEFISSIPEMERRKRAYLRLVLSFFTGAAVSAALLFCDEPLNTAAVLTAVAILLWFSFRYFCGTLENLKHTRVLLSETILVRVGRSGKVSIQLKDVAAVRIKRTTSDTVREIRLTLNNGRRVFAAGLDDCEDFCRRLLDRIDDNAAVKEFREPVDFDHPRFYRLLGLSVGVFSVLYLRFIVTADTGVFRIVELGILIYLTLFGGWWLWKRPFSQYGVGKLFADILFGSALLGTAVLLFVFDFVYI